MAKQDNRRRGINQALLEDMRTVFTTVGALCVTLHVTPPTWKRISDAKGVKEATAIKVVKEFFLLLRNLGDRNPVPEGVYRGYGLDMLAKHGDDIAHHRFRKFVVDVVPACQADIPDAGQRLEAAAPPPRPTPAPLEPADITHSE